MWMLSIYLKGSNDPLTEVIPDLTFVDHTIGVITRWEEESIEHIEINRVEDEDNAD